MMRLSALALVLLLAAAARPAAASTLSAVGDGGHRAYISVIVAQFDSGSNNDPFDAARRIDAILTPAEAKAVANEANAAGNAAFDPGYYLISTLADPGRLHESTDPSQFDDPFANAPPLPKMPV
jgi:hypothetical protein